MNGVRLVQTCGACPEQYDAFIGDELVGYLRLRHGYFYASYPGIDGDKVYDANTIGDGIFEWEERKTHLDRATLAIKTRHERRNTKDCPCCGYPNCDHNHSDKSAI